MYMKARPNHRIWQRSAVSGALGNLTKNKNLAFLTHYFLGVPARSLTKIRALDLGGFILGLKVPRLVTRMAEVTPGSCYHEVGQSSTRYWIRRRWV